MSIEYYFNNLEPTRFQRLINSLLVARFGEQVRLLPLRGKDGGRDAEMAPEGVQFLLDVTRPLSFGGSALKLATGRYLFQVKHHRTIDSPVASVRNVVVSDFEKEMRENVLGRTGTDAINCFFLVTNVPSSKEAIEKVDRSKAELLGERKDFHADVLWQEHVVAWLDQSPAVWPAFAELFAGGVVPQEPWLVVSNRVSLGHFASPSANSFNVKDWFVFAK